MAVDSPIYGPKLSPKMDWLQRQLLMLEIKIFRKGGAIKKIDFGVIKVKVKII